MAKVSYTRVTRVRGWFTRELTASQELLQVTPDLDSIAYENALDKLVKRWDKYEDTYIEFANDPDTAESVLSKEDEERNRRHIEFSKIQLQLRQKCSKPSPPTPPQGVSLPTPKMPVIKIPEFANTITLEKNLFPFSISIVMLSATKLQYKAKRYKITQCYGNK